jgi:hypothetical protein
MGGKSSPPPPDYSGMEALGREQLQFARDQYAEIMPLARRVADQQMATQNELMQMGREDRQYQMETFRPLEQGLVRDAERFSTEGFREQQARDAAAATGRAFGVQQDMSQRAMASRGVNPNSGAAMALQAQGNLGLAAQRANAMTGARNQAEQLGFARRMDVTGLGRGLSGSAQGAYGAATGAGSAGVNTSMAPGSQAMTGMAQSGQTMGSVLGSQTSIYNTAQSQADPFASIVGMGLGAYAGGFGSVAGKAAGSDIRLKQNIERVGTDERTGLAIYEFEYKANPGERFRGVMAHEVEVNFPEAVTTRADGYKAVFYERLGMQMVKV